MDHERLSGCIVPMLDNCRVSIGHAAIRYVAHDNCARFDTALLADLHPGQYDGSRTDHSAVADICVEVKPARRIMGQNDGVMVDEASRADVNALWPGAVDVRSGSNPRGWVDVHLPHHPPHDALPLLPERFPTHASTIGDHRIAIGNHASRCNPAMNA